MKLILTYILCSIFSCSLFAQLQTTLKGTVIDNDTKLPLANVTISIPNTSFLRKSDALGNFTIRASVEGGFILKMALNGFVTRTFPIDSIIDKVIDLGIIELSKNLLPVLENRGLIALSEEDIQNDEGQSENITGILQSSRDLFQNRAAFDWGQAFFRVRGYNSQNATVLINGIPMNKLYSGRPEWSNWGGLNDVMRNQEMNSGLSPSNHTFGGLLGALNISTHASLYRPGLRISSSYSNRSYLGRAMVTYNSGLQKNGLAYSFSGSRRFAKEGYINGTLYDSFGFFATVEYKPNLKNSIHLTGFFASNRRGQAAAITERVFQKLGRNYNPYWGFQEGVLRNSRVRKIAEPFLIMGHTYQNEKTTLSTTAAYQIGEQSRSRLDYNNAPNPNPNYWRYLGKIEEKPQIDWMRLYETNSNNIHDGVARYLLYNDVTADKVLTLSSILNTKLTPNFVMDLGGTYKLLQSDNFAQSIDYLGAETYRDSNPFALIAGKPARNDFHGNEFKSMGEKIKYNYNILSSQLEVFAQIQVFLNKLDFFISGKYSATNYQRKGLFLNQSFEESSLGLSKAQEFTNIGVKGGVTYKISGRHLVNLSATYFTKAPTLRNSFVNPRENNQIVLNQENEIIQSAELSYHVRSSKLKGRLTAFFTEFNKGTDINFFFAQVGSGTDFFQEVVRDINKRHLGLEFGLSYQASQTVKVFSAASYGEHTYTTNASVSVNFDTAGFNDDLLNTEGVKDLGASYIKGLRVANGPQQAYSLGVEYRDPKFWWISATTNFLSNGFIDISTISRTNDFFINPDDPFGLPLEEVDVNLARKLLKQQEFEGFYLLNLIGGKSWRLKNKYLSLFIGINNAFDQVYKTGGYEQSRTANYNDLVADTASGESQRNFGNKYWYGYGRTYFVNLAINF